MAQQENITLEQALTNIPAQSHHCIQTLHNHAVQSGFTPFGTQSGKKSDYYKIEYKKSKKDTPLYIFTAKGQRWDLKCKFFHLDQYQALLHELSDRALGDLLESRECRGEANGCTVGVKFDVDGKGYNLCRHGIYFRKLVSEDTADVWRLMEAEIAQREKSEKVPE